MSQRAGALGAAKGPGEGEHREREKKDGEEEKDGENVAEGKKIGAIEEGGAHGVQGVGDGIDAGKPLKPGRQDGHRKESAADDAGDAEEEPFAGIAALEDEDVGGGENAEPGKGEQRSDEYGEDGGPVGGAKREPEEYRSPENIHGDTNGAGEERVGGGTGEEHRERGLRDENVLESAGVAGLFEAAIESVEGGAEVVEEGKADERKGEVGGAGRQGMLEFGAIDEAGDVIESGGAEESFDGFEEEGGAVGLRDGEIAPEKDGKLAQGANHEPSLSAAAESICETKAGSAGAGRSRPVRRRKASSRVDVPVRALRAESVSQARRRPASMMAMRSARSSTSGRV